MGRKYKGAGQDNGATLWSNLLDPVSAQDAATKAYVDAWRSQSQCLSTPSGTITSTTLVDVLTVTLPAIGTYHFDAFLGVIGNGTSAQVGVEIGGTMSVSAYRFTATMWPTTGSQASGNRVNSTLQVAGLALASTGSTGAQQPVLMSGLFVATVAGTMTIAVSNIGAVNNFTVRSGSNLCIVRTA